MSNRRTVRTRKGVEEAQAQEEAEAERVEADDAHQRETQRRSARRTVSAERNSDFEPRRGPDYQHYDGEAQAAAADAGVYDG